MPDSSFETENRYRVLFEQAGDAILLIDPEDGSILEVNSKASTLLGYSKADLLTMTLAHFDVIETPEQTIRHAKRISKGGKEIFETKQKRQDGVIIDVEVSVQPIVMGGKTVLQAIWRDISERTRVGEALRESEERFHAMFEKHDAVMLLIEPESGAIIDANIAAQTYYGYSLEVFRKMAIQDINTMPKEKVAQLCRQAASESLNFFVFPHRLSNGEIRTVEVHSSPITVAGQTILFSIVHDITDRKLAEEALRESEMRFRALVEHAPDAIVVLDPRRGVYVDANEKACALYKLTREELLAKSPFELSPLTAPDGRSTAEAAKELFQLALDGGNPHFEWVQLDSTGNEIPCEVNLTRLPSSTGWLIRASMIDITERKRTEEALQRSQKLESLGILAGGIAHDFNNLLGAIYGRIELADEAATDPELHTHLSMALGTIDRGRHLTQQLITFAEGGVPIKTIAHPFPYLREIVQFALSGSNVSCSYNIPDNLHACRFDKNQMAQVIENIVINAKQAMSDGGTIEISARNVTLNQGQLASPRQGDYVRISIHDHGIGMPKEILPRIFDPFYSTKATGHGLGLATCHSIVKRHGGCIDVESEPGKGSTFTVFLPAEAAPPEVPKEIPTGKHEGSGTFIVMDDEDELRETIAFVLGSFGYNALCAKDGQEAIDLLSAEIDAKRKVAALLLDLTVPGGMGGQEAISEIRKISPGIPVIVASGYAEDPVMANPDKYGFVASLRKPFKLSELAQLLNNHLGKTK